VSRKSLANLESIDDIIQLEKTHWQPRKLIGIWLVILGLFLTKLLQGNLEIPSIAGFSLCGWEYWCVFSLFILLCLFLIYVNSEYALWEHERKVKCKYRFSEGDLQWTQTTVISVTLIAFFGGMLSSIVGVGGGIIFSPLLISLDMHPTVAVSTAIYIESYMVLTTTVQYIISNMLYYKYAIWLGCFSTVGTLLGLSII
jgi:hypothetical protein